jgi:hypothetical protein
MSINLRIRAAAMAAATALTVCALIACQAPASTTGTNEAISSPGMAPSASSATRPYTGPSRDLSQDERAGGHILRKHVGQTEQQLRDRLAREQNITGASTYTDRETAERAVGTAIAQSRRRIDGWLDRSGRHPNLVLDYASEDPIGRTMNRGENQSRPCNHALVVLKYAGPSRYYVLTSYPECR